MGAWCCKLIKPSRDIISTDGIFVTTSLSSTPTSPQYPVSPYTIIKHKSTRLDDVISPEYFTSRSCYRIRFLDNEPYSIKIQHTHH